MTPEGEDRAKQGEALPCPFCGSTSVQLIQTSCWQVYCRMCCAWGSGHAEKADAIAAWNRRESRAATRAGEGEAGDETHRVNWIEWTKLQARVVDAEKERDHWKAKAEGMGKELVDEIAAGVMQPPAAGGDAAVVERVARAIMFAASDPSGDGLGDGLDDWQGMARAAMKALAGGGA